MQRFTKERRLDGWFLAASVAFGIAAAPALADHFSEVADDHPSGGGTPPTNGTVILPSDSPNIAGPDACALDHLHGDLTVDGRPEFNHGDPNPPVCGHGFAFPIPHDQPNHNGPAQFIPPDPGSPNGGPALNGNAPDTAAEQIRSIFDPNGPSANGRPFSDTSDRADAASAEWIPHDLDVDVSPVVYDGDGRTVSVTLKQNGGQEPDGPPDEEEGEPTTSIMRDMNQRLTLGGSKTRSDNIDPYGFDDVPDGPAYGDDGEYATGEDAINDWLDPSAEDAFDDAPTSADGTTPGEADPFDLDDVPEGEAFGDEGTSPTGEDAIPEDWADGSTAPDGSQPAPGSAAPNAHPQTVMQDSGTIERANTVADQLGDGSIHDSAAEFDRDRAERLRDQADTAREHAEEFRELAEDAREAGDEASAREREQRAEELEDQADDHDARADEAEQDADQHEQDARDAREAQEQREKEWEQTMRQRRVRQEQIEEAERLRVQRRQEQRRQRQEQAFRERVGELSFSEAVREGDEVYREWRRQQRAFRERVSGLSHHEAAREGGEVYRKWLRQKTEEYEKHIEQRRQAEADGEAAGQASEPEEEESAVSSWEATKSVLKGVSVKYGARYLGYGPNASVVGTVVDEAVGGPGSIGIGSVIEVVVFGLQAQETAEKNVEERIPQMKDQIDQVGELTAQGGLDEDMDPQDATVSGGSEFRDAFLELFN